MWCVRLNNLQCKHNNASVSAVLHATVNNIKVLHNNAFTTNLCRWQKCKLHVQVFKRNIIIPTNLHSIILTNCVGYDKLLFHER